MGDELDANGDSATREAQMTRLTDRVLDIAIDPPVTAPGPNSTWTMRDKTSFDLDDLFGDA